MRTMRIIFVVVALVGFFVSSAVAQINSHRECADITELHRIPNFEEEITRVHSASFFIWATVSVDVGDRLNPNRRPLPQINFRNKGKGILIADNKGPFIATVGHLLSVNPTDVANALRGHPQYGDLADVNRIDLQGTKFTVAVGTTSDSLSSVLTTVETIQLLYDFYGSMDGFALLRVPRQFSDMDAVEVAQSSCIENKGVGTVVWEVGGDVREENVITSTDINRHEVSNTGDENIFRVSTPIWPGASGSGVFAYDLHKAKLILEGIVTGHEGVEIPGFGLLPIRGIIYKINSLASYLREN